jgi:hypothetical protein
MNFMIKSLREIIKNADSEEMNEIIQKITLLENQKREKTNLLGTS